MKRPRNSPLQLSKWSYRADFFVYPLLIAGLALRSLWGASPHAAGHWFVATVAGLLAWTAVEYALHRWVLHRVPPFRHLHALHHAHPGALIGTPTWVTAALFLGLWAALASGTPAAVAAGLTTGLMTGYLAYAVVHDAVHHRRARPGSWLDGAKRRHAQHHRPGATCNFGVSTGVWDAVFGSAVDPGRVVGDKARP